MADRIDRAMAQRETKTMSTVSHETTTMLTLTQDVRTTAVDTWLGAGFNIYGAYDLAKSALARKVFDADKAARGTQDTPFGRLPKYITYRDIKTADFFAASGSGRESFQSQFAARASVDFSAGMFSGHVEASYGRQVAESSEYSFANISWREMLGTLVIERMDHPYLSDEFLEALGKLPDKAEEANLSLFADFFDDFGAYFVSQLTVGGSFEYYVAVKQAAHASSTQIQAMAEAEYKGLFVSGKASASMSSEQSWQSYRSNKTSLIHVKGGGDKERDRVSHVDTRSLDSMSADTAAAYDRWRDTVAAHPTVMDFRLTGIWKVCGAKQKVVEDAFRQYGRMMSPRLVIETQTGGADRGFRPSVFLGGHAVPAEAAAPVNPDWGGYRLVVIDRKQPSDKGVVLSKLYSTPNGDAAGYKKVFDTMLADLRGKNLLDNRYFFVLASYGGLNSFPPSPQFAEVMREAGAGRQLNAWIDSAHGVGTTYVKDFVNYILVGIMKSGPSAGLEVFGVIPTTNTPPTSRRSSINLEFYSLGAGKPFVLGRAERTE
jgi:hypothetical protein